MLCTQGRHSIHVFILLLLCSLVWPRGLFSVPFSFSFFVLFVQSKFLLCFDRPPSLLQGTVRRQLAVLHSVATYLPSQVPSNCWRLLGRSTFCWILCEPFCRISVTGTPDTCTSLSSWCLSCTLCTSTSPGPLLGLLLWVCCWYCWYCCCCCCCCCWRRWWQWCCWWW